MKRIVSIVLLACWSPVWAQTMKVAREPARESVAARVSAAGAAASDAKPSQSTKFVGGSLFRATVASAEQAPDPAQARLADVSFFSVPEPKPRVLKKHDLVQIIVREESEFSSEGTTETSKQASIEAKIDEFIKLNLSNVQVTGNGIGASPPSIKADAQRDFSGEGTVDRSDSFTARIQAEVVDVKPNGTVVLQARKEITTDDEFQRMTLTGTCRAEDISADNSVLSTQLYDLTLKKTHRGDVRNATRKGWAPRLLDALNPF